MRRFAIVPAVLAGALVMTTAAHAVTFNYVITPGSSITFPGNDVEQISGNFTLPTSPGPLFGSVTLSGSGPEAGVYTCPITGSECTAIVTAFESELGFNEGPDDVLPAGITSLILDFSGSPGVP